KLRSFTGSFFTLLLPLAIIASIYTGFATPTEAGGLAVAFIIVLGLFVYRKLTWRRLVSAVRSAVSTSTMILLLICFGGLMTQALTLGRVPQMLATAIEDASLAPILVFTIMIAMYVVLGTVLEATSMIIVTIPILFPLLPLMNLDPVAFAVIVVLAME